MSFIGSAILPTAMLCTSFVIITTLIGRKTQHDKAKKVIPFSKNSPIRALILALAGTLGVGNITGVTAAIISGGIGAVFWMWVGSLLVMAIKYAEVYLAVTYRQRDNAGFFGGAMYYIKDGTSKLLGTRSAAIFGGIFAVLCVANSLITGNIVQANAAACVISSGGRVKTGIILALLLLISIILGTHRIERITAYLIPPLTTVYIIMTLYIIISEATLAKEIFGDIIGSAFNVKSAVGGGVGIGMSKAVRYGIMRGIFSNEAGCGTSPTAHASAETDSPHAQGKLGIAEVIFDTPVLCTLTAFIMLIADRKYSLIPYGSESDAAGVTLNAFSMLGNFRCILSFVIVMFAYASIIAQIYYGTVAMGYLTKKRGYMLVYYTLSILCTVLGSIIDSETMWLCADIILGTMTLLNCIALILIRRDLK